MYKTPPTNVTKNSKTKQNSKQQKHI